MGITSLIGLYQPKVYQGLGDLLKVDKMINMEQMLGVGRIIAKHGYEVTVGVCKSHQHDIELDDTEVLVEKPVAEEGKNIVEGGGAHSRWMTRPMEKKQAVDELGAIPIVIAVDKETGRFAPVKYGLGGIVADGVPSAWKDDVFLGEVLDYLHGNNLEDKLMLALLRPALPKGMTYVETGDIGERFSEIHAEDIQVVMSAPAKWSTEKNKFEAGGKISDYPVVDSTYKYQKKENGVSEMVPVLGC